MLLNIEEKNANLPASAARPAAAAKEAAEGGAKARRAEVRALRVPTC